MVQSLLSINFSVFPVNREMQSIKTDKYVNHYAKFIFLTTRFVRRLQQSFF